MKFEASHYDTVEWDPESLEPGKIFNEMKRDREVEIGDRREITLKSPCRIDVGLLDYSALKFTDENDYKAGEMSFAGDVYTIVNVKLTNDPEIKIESDREPFVRHYALLIKKMSGYEGGFKIRTRSHSYRHVGFGSSAVMGETVVYAINELLGKPFDFRRLRRLVAYNFVEEADSKDGKLFPGASTGGSFNTIRRGGFVITSAECEEIFHSDIPEDMYFVVGIPEVNVAGPEESETDVNVMGWERHNERINAGKTALWILMEVMPYWVKGDYDKVGDAFFNYTLFGGKAMQMLFYRNDLHGILFEQMEMGLEGGWMTSAGPGLVAYTQSEEKKNTAIKVFKDRGCRTVVVRPDNRGIREVEALQR